VMIKRKCPYWEREVEVIVLGEFISHEEGWKQVYLCSLCKRFLGENIG